MSTFRRDLFATVGSDKTSEVYFAGDAEEMTLNTVVASATTLVFQASNDTGFREALVEGNWSTLTTVASAATNGMYNIEPGFRWFRCLRETASAASWTQATLAGRNDDGRGY